MRAEAYDTIISASADNRRGVFQDAAQRLGTALGNVEKDFWVCWTLDVLYHGLSDGPRLLFKGGTSLSKAYGLISRFSEDIDVTVFRDDLHQPASVAELEGLSGKKRLAKLDAIRDACRAYITGPLKDAVSNHVAEATKGQGRVEVDAADPDGQTLLVIYPAVEATPEAYIRPAVRIESGAKSALDPNEPATIRPYIAESVPDLDLSVAGVRTINPERTFWDKVVIAHGTRKWYDRRGALRQEGQRISRHYYDLHCLLHSTVGRAAVKDAALGADCVRHAQMFFNRPDFDLQSARRGSFALVPADEMLVALTKDYAAMEVMIFGDVPPFEEVLRSVAEIEQAINT